MDNSIRKDEARIVIRPAKEPENSARPIPAEVFQRAFNTFFEALKTANSEINSEKSKSEFFIAHLKIGSNEVGIFEQRRSGTQSLSPAIDYFEQMLGSVYRSDFSSAVESPKMAQRIINFGKAIKPEYPGVVAFPRQSIPLDEFFVEQTKRLAQAIGAPPIERKYFAGSTIGAFDGTIGNIDYRGAVWRGHLVLPGGGAQIECVFDRRRGEDEFNPHGNKRVSITGRAIYTGDGPLPERIEVIEIEDIPLAIEPTDIRGSLSGAQYRVGWRRDGKNFQ